jgi:pimeloyl-ACP methyl ester carboxylesterase
VGRRPAFLPVAGLCFLSILPRPMIHHPVVRRRPRLPGTLPAALWAVVLTLSLTSCTQYATLRQRIPPFASPAAGASHTTAAASLEAALRTRGLEPLDAIGQCIDVAYAASLALKRNPADADALAAYNYAMSRAFGALYNVRQDPWAEQLTFPGKAGKWRVAAKTDPRPQWRNPSLYKFQPADEFELSGRYVANRMLKPGLGAPLIASYRTDVVRHRDPFAPGKDVSYGVTAVARFRGDLCEVSFEDPLSIETVDFNGHRFELAADFTAPLAQTLVAADPRRMELARFLNPGKFSETARLARLQPYDPKKIPIVCVHGLKDSPATWVPMVNALRADPYIRQHYQVWFYSYPSGYPYPHSAAIFRRQMDAIKEVHPDHKDVVLIGHSMGGVISRSLITTSDEIIWNQLIQRPPGQSGLERESEQLLRDALIFQARDDVARAIFIAAPHRGSELASIWVGRLGSRLVRAPSTLLDVGNQLKNIMTLDPTAVTFHRMPNSVDTLSPNSRFVRAINAIPTDPDIPFHSIMGDRGRGGNLDRTRPVSSDGVVPFWSSHLEGARSERVVPSNHSAHQNPQAIDEVRRILREHVGR